jgi:hypothetical protein
MKSLEFDELVRALLKAAREHGLISEEPTPFGDELGFRLIDGCVRFRKGNPAPDPKDAFFRDYYGNLATALREPVHPLFGFEAREHTAQVDAERRKIREKRFRFGPKERQELGEAEKHLRDIGEASRFLPVLFCSPTMELGVDISALNAVYLRNVPPTPANYAQRSGRAGRSGQAALVLTYSSSQSPHDQYFFRDPRAMVHGEVRPPLLDLANRDLVESHLWATWLACTELPLDPSIAQLLVLSDQDRPLKPEVTQPMVVPRVGEDARRRIERVLSHLDSELTAELAPWYPGAATFAREVVERAPRRFHDAFGRWRELLLAAEQQRDATRRTMDDYSAPQKEKRTAQSRHAQAIAQLELLQDGSSTHSSDFNTYRYLATEGFLPGYNFPRLPLMAYIPATTDGRGKQTYLQRPRFLALSEFGPRSLVYHEGRAYRVVRAMFSVGQQGNGGRDVRLPTETLRLCKVCGAGHRQDDLSMCHACGSPLTSAEVINHTYRIENVATLPADRITANDEERQRQGFEIVTTFELALRDGERDRRDGVSLDAGERIASLTYGPSATITRINKGLRRRKHRTELGFKMDPLSGYWEKNDDGEEPNDPTAAPAQPIVPTVRDHKNALLLMPAGIAPGLGALTTIQHALLRGVEAVFQLEQGEILAEPMPTRDERSGFLFYEAAEGGAGVLTRLVAEPERLAEVARRALHIMHFDVLNALPDRPQGLAVLPNTTCVAACYRCIMSYYNQPDHEFLDRRDEGAQNFLLRLARSETRLEGPRSSRHPSNPPSRLDGDDAVLAGFMAQCRKRDFPEPDGEAIVIGDQRVALVWRAHYVAAPIDQLEPDLVGALEAKGFEVVAVGREETGWSAALIRLAELLGRVQ